MADSKATERDGVGHWATDWSSQWLNMTERHEFEYAIAYLYDWFVLRLESEERVRQQLSILPYSVTEARQPIYCGAIVSYVIVELVMLCQPTDEDTIASKLHKLVDLLDYLVNERQVFDVQVIDQEVEIICKDKEACPELSEGSSTLGDDLNIFQNLQTFASKLYARNLLTNLAPAALALDVYFGPTPMRRAETFLVVTDWLIRANKELHRDNEVFDAKWPEWYGIICLYTAEYGRNRDKASVRLSTSGRAAARRMEDVHPELAELHIEVLKAIEQIHANDATGYGKMSAAAKLALVQRTIKDLERVSSSKGPIAREAGTIE